MSERLPVWWAGTLKFTVAPQMETPTSICPTHWSVIKCSVTSLQTKTLCPLYWQGEKKQNIKVLTVQKWSAVSLSYFFILFKYERSHKSNMTFCQSEATKSRFLASSDRTQHSRKQTKHKSLWSTLNMQNKREGNRNEGKTSCLKITLNQKQPQCRGCSNFFISHW